MSHLLTPLAFVALKLLLLRLLLLLPLPLSRTDDVPREAVVEATEARDLAEKVGETALIPRRGLELIVLILVVMVSRMGSAMLTGLGTIMRTIPRDATTPQGVAAINPITLMEEALGVPARNPVHSNRWTAPSL
jgi:hypothetical protein